MIGNKCLKLVKPANVSYWANIQFNLESSGIIGETLFVKCYVKSLINPSIVQIYTDSTYLMNLMSIPVSDEFILISNSFTIPECEIISIRFLFSPRDVNASTLYVDDLNLSV